MPSNSPAQVERLLEALNHALAVEQKDASDSEVLAAMFVFVYSMTMAALLIGASVPAIREALAQIQSLLPAEEITPLPKGKIN